MDTQVKRKIGVWDILLYIAWAFTVIGASVAFGDEVVDRIVAIVNDDIITDLEVQKEMQPYEEKIKAVGYDPEKEQQMLYKVRKDIVEKMVNQKLADQEIKRNNINVSDADIDNNIEQIKANKMWTDEDFRKALEREGMTMESYRQILKEQALRARLVNTVVRSNIVITKEDVAAYYEKNIDTYQGELKYHLRNIIMRVREGASTEEKQAVLEAMQEVRARLEKGADFASLARQFSQSMLAKDGGDLGILAYQNFSDQLKAALAGLSRGDITTILDTDQGYQIFYIEDILKEGGKTLEDAYGEIEEQLFKELSDKAYEEWLEKLRANSHIKITL